jgi:hypothetical protein
MGSPAGDEQAVASAMEDRRGSPAARQKPDDDNPPRVPDETSDTVEADDVPATGDTGDELHGAAELPPPANTGQLVYYVVGNSTKYHRAGCRHVTANARKITAQEARDRYTPCKVCKPDR